MRLDDLTHVLRRLQAGKIRFLIAGGLAVFAGLGFTPRLPVSLEDFADPEKRAVWIESKGMQVFSLVSAVHRSLVVDIFASSPFPFDAEWDRASWIAFPDASLRLPFVCRATLIRMKQEAGRPVDREDVAHLQSLPDEAS